MYFEGESMKGITKAVMVILFIASSVLGQTGDAIFSQSYQFSSVDGGTHYASLTDDFTPDFSGEFRYVTLWEYFETTPPAEIFLRIAQDNGDVNPNNATSLLSGNFAVFYVVTGDSINSQPIYEATVDLGQTVAVDVSNLYWLETGLIFNAYLLYQDPVVFGSPMWYFEGGQYHSFAEQSKSWDSFFELKTPVALERSSWGAIKASY